MTTKCRAGLVLDTWLNCCDRIWGLLDGAALGFWGSLGMSDSAETSTEEWHRVLGPVLQGDQENHEMWAGALLEGAARIQSLTESWATEPEHTTLTIVTSKLWDGGDFHFLVLSYVFRIGHTLLLYLGGKDLICVITVTQKKTLSTQRCSFEMLNRVAVVFIRSPTRLNSILDLIRKPTCSPPPPMTSDNLRKKVAWEPGPQVQAGSGPPRFLVDRLSNKLILESRNPTFISEQISFSLIFLLRNKRGMERGLLFITIS